MFEILCRDIIWTPRPISLLHMRMWGNNAMSCSAHISYAHMSSGCGVVTRGGAYILINANLHFSLNSAYLGKFAYVARRYVRN